MAFLPEDGSGVTGANSLTTVAHADQYHALRGNAAWASLGQPEKEQRLVVATDYVVDVFGGALAGVVATTTQGLPFPRLGSMFVPDKVQDAVAELALVSKTTPLLVNVGRGKKKVKVGSLEVEYDGESGVQTKFTSAVLKLAPFLAGYGQSSVMAKLVRC